MKKRMISLLLALVMVLGMLPAMAPAAKAYTITLTPKAAIYAAMGDLSFWSEDDGKQGQTQGQRDYT